VGGLRGEKKLNFVQVEFEVSTGFNRPLKFQERGVRGGGSVIEHLPACARPWGPIPTTERETEREREIERERERGDLTQLRGVLEEGFLDTT
jgi:hypothetical protein